jgi:excisionase family DNA binding protein
MAFMPEQSPVLTVEEAAELLGLSRSTAYDAVRTGDLPSIRIGRRILIPRARLEALLAGGEKEQEKR